MLSPYLCPDCSETWNHSPHYRWLSPENQKRSDWPQTHGENVCRDSSPLRNLFECHLRWKAPFLKEGGDTEEKVRKERTVTEVRKEMDATKTHKARTSSKEGWEEDTTEPFFPTPIFQVIQTHTQFLPPRPYLAEALTLPATVKNCGVFRKPMGESEEMKKLWDVRSI